MSLKLQLDGEAWSAVLADLAQALDKEGTPLRLCLIGSAACLFGGMEGRTSADLDIGSPRVITTGASCRRRRKNPACSLIPNKRSNPTVRICNWSSRDSRNSARLSLCSLSASGNCHLYRPPVENLVAAKLIRAEPEGFGRHSIPGEPSSA